MNDVLYSELQLNVLNHFEAEKQTPRQRHNEQKNREYEHHMRDEWRRLLKRESCCCFRLEISLNDAALRRHKKMARHFRFLSSWSCMYTPTLFCCEQSYSARQDSNPNALLAGQNATPLHYRTPGCLVKRNIHSIIVVIKQRCWCNGLSSLPARKGVGSSPGWR